MSWSAAQVRTFARQAVERAGGKRVWTELLSHSMREAFVAREVVSVLIGQAAEVIPTLGTADVQALIRDTMREAGVWSEPKEGE